MVVSPVRPGPWQARGVSLMELLIATALGALLLSSLASVAQQGVQARLHTRDSAEAVYQARFALERITLAARASLPQAQPPNPVNTSGGWFAPVYFCINATGQLIETTSTDTACSGTRVIAERVSSLAITQPAGQGPLEAVSALVAVTVSGPGGGPVTLSERLRFAGKFE
jgi:Tfp pilus assembly protein PilV